MNKLIAKIALVSAVFGSFGCTQMVGDESAEQPEAQPEQVLEGDAEEAKGHIEPQQIQSAVRTQYFPNAKACYEGLLAEDASAAGKVMLRFAIVDGAAEGVTVEATEGNLDDDGFKACMGDALADVSFPVVTGKVTVSYPIAFSDE